MTVRSPAKQEIMDFVRTTKMGEVYEFVYNGTEMEAADFVKRMRTELSRLRALVLKTGRKLSKFKVLVVKLEKLSDKPPRTRVVLRKSDNGAREVDEFLDADVLKELVGED